MKPYSFFQIEMNLLEELDSDFSFPSTLLTQSPFLIQNSLCSHFGEDECFSLINMVTKHDLLLIIEEPETKFISPYPNNAIFNFSNYESFSFKTLHDHELYYYTFHNINMANYSYDFFDCCNFSEFKPHTSINQKYSNIFSVTTTRLIVVYIILNQIHKNVIIPNYYFYICYPIQFLDIYVQSFTNN